MRRPRSDIARAAKRVGREQLVPAAELSQLLGAPPRTVERWIVSGFRGVYLDGLHRPGVGWMSSVPAALRFVRALYELDATEAEAAEDLARRGVAAADCTVMVPTGEPPKVVAVSFARKRPAC